MDQSAAHTHDFEVSMLSIDVSIFLTLFSFELIEKMIPNQMLKDGIFASN